MKTPIAITLIIIGGLLVLAPELSAERQKDRIAAFYQKQGNGAVLPDEMKARNAYDWACMILGGCLAFAGIRRAAGSGGNQSP